MAVDAIPEKARPRPSLKPPGSGGKLRRRRSVTFSKTADIRLVYQMAAEGSSTSSSSSMSPVSSTPTSVSK